MKNTRLPSDYSVIELRRYVTTPGGRERFARYFETYFPEAFQQLGAFAFGHFFERTQANRFTWLRGYKDMDARAVINGAFYYGPVWKEHKATLNSLLVDNDDVLLLRPLNPDCRIPALRAVDLLAEPAGAQGIVVCQIFKIAPGAFDELVQAAEQRFQTYQGKGVVEAGILTTLHQANNFPQHPIRNDGNYLVWLGVLRDEAALAALRPALDASARTLEASALLAGPTELVLLDPAARSRLRWIPVPEMAAVECAA